jgi:hypothetical protein
LAEEPLEIEIEIAYAEPQRVILKSVRLPEGARVADALHRAALDPDFAGVDLGASFGIFGRPVRAEQILHDGDRLEIYRPLAADPKIARRQRAKQTRR